MRGTGDVSAALFSNIGINERIGDTRLKENKAEISKMDCMRTHLKPKEAPTAS